MTNIDFLILDFINKNFKTPVLDTIMGLFSKLGSMGVIWIVIAIIFLCLPKLRALGITLLIGLLIELIVFDVALKLIVARARPFDAYDIFEVINKPTTFSFPSGHTTSSFIAAIIIFMKNKKMGSAAFVTASIIGFSRIYLCVHYPSDVLFGIIFGCLTGYLVFKFIYPKIEHFLN